jgi:hypothetical protein
MFHSNFRLKNELQHRGKDGGKGRSKRAGKSAMIFSLEVMRCPPSWIIFLIQGSYKT